MIVTYLNPETVSKPEGGYSHGVEVKGAVKQLYISGQIPEGPDGAVPTGFEQQCEMVWRNISEILKAGGLNLGNIVKVNTYLTDRGQIEKNGEIRRKYLGELRPALTVVIVQTLDPIWLLEIDVIAVSKE